MQRLKPVDVVVIGGGWTGLAMAKEITTRTNLDVVVLERGPARKLADYHANMDEVDYSLRFRMLQNIAEETLTHRHTLRDSAAPVRQYGHVRIGTGTGGSGEHWTAVANRYPADTFVIATALKERFGNKLPADLAVQDWSFTWDEIEPYYTKVEEMMGIGGKAGNIRGKLIEDGNIFEGPRSKEYPVGPHKVTYSMSIFRDAAKAMGYHPYITPAATLPFDYKNPDGISRPGCAYCGYCMLYGCMISAKAQPTNLLMPILRKQKSFSLRNGCWVRRIVHRNGKAEGVVFVDEKGQEVMQPANIVILSTFTPNNVRLLLLSKIGTPYDPVSGTGTLGKNFTHQMGGGSGVAIVYPKYTNSFMAAGGQGVYFSDFDGFNRLDPDAGILRGGTFTGGGGGGAPISSFGGMPPGAAPRNWGSAWKKAALEYRDRMGRAPGFSAEHLAYKHNFVDLDPTYTDKYGDPLLRTTMDWTEHEQKVRAFAAKVSAEMGKKMAEVSGGKLIESRVTGARAGRVSGRYQTAVYATSHLHGGAIMGSSPGDSVVNTYLQHWDVPNLFVVGASAFPHAGPTNPTLTALSITFRSADALIDRYLKRPGELL
ncbi:MAG TPA: GMC family oxidoreductase [Bryobacteraceae bacterium]|nr:GMC family oxidoreductase [Bryobacteraceae bacterium]